MKISRFFPFIMEWRPEPIFDLLFETVLYTTPHCFPDLKTLLKVLMILVYFTEENIHVVICLMSLSMRGDSAFCGLHRWASCLTRL